MSNKPSYDELVVEAEKYLSSMVPDYSKEVKDLLKWFYIQGHVDAMEYSEVKDG